MSTILQVEELCVSLAIKKRIILDHISFSVEPGECLGILGESGSGKSMTAKAILGLLDKSFRVSGKVLFQDRELLSMDPGRLRQIRGKEISVVLQNPMTCFDSLFRIEDQIEETLKTHTDWKKERIREESLKLLKIMQIHDGPEVLRKYPHQLSGGMLQRIMIGLAMILEPKLIIADEPTTAIDSITQYEILEEFRRIKKEHKTAMIFISHDLGAISRVADRIIVMNTGQIVDEGTFLDILNEPEDPYTKMLVEKRKAVMERYQNMIHKKYEEK